MPRDDSQARKSPSFGLRIVAIAILISISENTSLPSRVKMSPFWGFFYRLNAAMRGAFFSDPLDALVYARHGRELMGCKSPVREPEAE